MFTMKSNSPPIYDVITHYKLKTLIRSRRNLSQCKQVMYIGRRLIAKFIFFALLYFPPELDIILQNLVLPDFLLHLRDTEVQLYLRFVKARIQHPFLFDFWGQDTGSFFDKLTHEENHHQSELLLHLQVPYQKPPKFLESACASGPVGIRTYMIPSRELSKSKLK